MNPSIRNNRSGLSAGAAALASLALLSAGAQGCSRDTVETPTDRIRITLDNDYSLPFRPLARKPYHYSVLFFPNGEDARALEDFCPEEGGPAAVPPGGYSAFVFDLGGTSALVRGRESLESLTVTGEEGDAVHAALLSYCVAAAEEGKNVPLIKEPSPFFGGSAKEISVPVTLTTEEPFSVNFATHSLLCQSRMTFTGLKNTQYINSLQVFVTNIASGRNICNGTPCGEPAAICFFADDVTEDSARGTFNHFGFLDVVSDENAAYVERKVTAYVVLADYSGSRWLFVRDVTAQAVRSADGCADFTVEIDFTVPEGKGPGNDGGLTPQTQDWENTFRNVTIGG